MSDVADKHREIDKLAAEIKREVLDADMIPIRGGAFKMGDPPRDATVKDFLMDATETTVEAYGIFLLDTRRAPPPQWKELPEARIIEGVRFMPISMINFEEAQAFAAWAGKRLPTEEEWERAARGIDGRTFPWGTEKWIDTDGLPRANAIDEVLPTQPSLKPVRSYPNGRSLEGVYDLAGNVWEFTSTQVKEEDGLKVVLKGGCYLVKKDACRGFVRLPDSPDMRHVQVGFRCVRDGR